MQIRSTLVTAICSYSHSRKRHLLLIVPQVWLEAPQPVFGGRQPRAAGGNVTAVVRVAVRGIVHTTQQQIPRHQRCRRS